MNRLPALVLALILITCPVYAAIDFDGTDDLVDLGTGLDNNGELTISAWINADALTTRRLIVGNGNSSGAAIDYWLELGRTSGKLSALRSADELCVTGGTTLSTGTWYHVAVVISGSSSNWTCTLYLDGSNDGSASVTINANATNEQTAIGRGGAFSGSYFDGQIEDVRIFNRALAAQEVATLAKSRLRVGGVIGGLMAQYSMDDQPVGDNADGDTVRDLTGAANGTANDGATDGTMTWTSGPGLSYPPGVA